LSRRQINPNCPLATGGKRVEKMTIIDIRQEKHQYCSILTCKRRGFYVFTESDPQQRIGFYPLCRKHFVESIGAPFGYRYSDAAKRQIEELKGNL
jgi:hypothetical protein